MRNDCLKIYSFLYVFFVHSGFSPAWSQEAADTLLQRVSAMSGDSAQIQYLCRYAMQISLSDTAKGAYYARTALAWSEQKRYRRGIVASLNTLAMQQRRRAKYVEAAQLLTRALRISEQDGLLQSQASTLNNLGIVYWNLNNFADARHYYERALAINQQLKDQAGMGSALQNLGMIQSHLIHTDSAILLYNLALAKFDSIQDLNSKAAALNNLGNLHRKIKQYSAALSYFRQAYKIFSLKNNRHSQCIALNNIGVIYQELNQTDSSLLYFQEAMAHAKALGALRELYNAHNGMYKTYQLKGLPQLALQQLEAAVALKDTLLSAEKNKQILDLKHQYEQEKAVYISQQDALAAKEKTRQATLGILAAIITAAAIIFALRQRLRRKNVALQLLQNETARQAAEQAAQRLQIEKQEADLAHQNRELTRQTMYLAQKNELLQAVHEQVKALKNEQIGPVPIQKISRFIEHNLDRDSDWEAFRLQFESVHPDFFKRLLQLNPELTARDLRMCAYLRLNLSTKEIAALLNYSVRGVETNRYRLRKKLQIAGELDLSAWMHQV